MLKKIEYDSSKRNDNTTSPTNVETYFFTKLRHEPESVCFMFHVSTDGTHVRSPHHSDIQGTNGRSL